MSRLLLAFAAGVALTSTTFLFLAASPESAFQSQISSEHLPPLVATETVSNDPGSGEVTRDVPREVVRTERTATSPTSQLGIDGETLTEDLIRTIPREDLIPTMIDVDHTKSLLEREIMRRQLVASLADKPPPVMPIVLPPEFDWLSEDPNGPHERFQRERYDPSWAPTTELQLRSYIDGHAKFAEEYGNPTINCRTTMCEIAVVAYGGEAAEGLDRSSLHTEMRIENNFRSIISSFADQLVANQFDFHPAAFSGRAHRKGGVTTILWHLHRNPEDYLQ